MKYIILGLLLCNCSDPMPPDTEALSATWCFNMPEADIPVFQEAMTEWNSVTGITTWERNESHCDKHITMVESGDIHLKNHIGYGSYNIYYQAGVSGDQLKNLALHELGHIAHLSHSIDQKDIMYPSVGTGVVHLSNQDIDQFFQINWK